MSVAMLRYEQLPASMDPDALMDLAAGLRELLGDLHHLEQVPAYLKDRLGLGPTSLAIFTPDQIAPMVLVSNATLALPDLARELLDLANRGPVPATQTAHLLGTPAFYNVRTIDAGHQLVLILHAIPVDARETAADLLALLSGYLARHLRTTVSWQTYPSPLGQPFEQLTEREWVVLCGLNSEDGEKQLADRLHLSPHTLHSHIKSIYRKVGVQGRLPLLQRLQEAVRAYRLRLLEQRQTPESGPL